MNLRWSVVCASLVCSSVAFAQAQLVPADEIKTADATDLDGWAPFLALTSTINLTSNSHVVGQVDGFSTLFGLGLTGGADYVHGRHVMRSSLSISESFARTPVLDEFIKTNDVVKLEGIYNYFLTTSMGLYGRLSLATSLFAADDVRGKPTTWLERNPDDPLMPILLNQAESRQRLADPFSPLTINESVGAFIDPVRAEKLTIQFRSGVAGRHTLASDVLVIDDDDATPAVEVQRLRDVHQLGFEAFGGVSGKSKDGKASYRAGLSLLLPFVNNDKDNRTVDELMRVGFEGQLTFQMYSWMSLVYSVSVTRDPQLFAKGSELTQVQNTLLLTFQFTLVKKPEKKKPPTKEELELEAAKKRADEAEKRAQEAERKAQEKERVPLPTPEPPLTVPGPVPTPEPTTTPP